MKKKLISVLLSLLMCVNVTGIPAGAIDGSVQEEVSAESSAKLLTDDPEPVLEFVELNAVETTSKYGLSEVIYYDQFGNEVAPNLVTETEIDGTYLPERYNAYEKGYVTDVKDQGNYNVCWSFAGLSCVESSLIKQGLADRNIDLSERHLNWFTNGKDCTDTSDPLYGGCKNLGTAAYDKGGSIYDVIFTLARGSGPVLESDVPYSNTKALSEDLRYKSLARLSEAELYAPSQKPIIKQAIMDHGSLFCSMRWSDDYWNTTTNGYYNGTDTLTENDGHAVTIVGWDDSFSKYNFKKGIPSEDGAWIIKNSWGTDKGDNGFFYVSYEDITIAKIASVTMSPWGEYSNIYQYDGYNDSYLETMKKDNKPVGFAMANVFTAADNEYIEAVSFFTESADRNYIIRIYKDLTDANSPTSGNLIYESQSQKMTFAGYHTVKLSKKAYVAKGHSFSVVVIQPDANSGVRLAGGKVKRGLSFLSSYADNEIQGWGDLYTISSKAPIKAFTNAAPEESDIVSINSTNFPDTKFRELVKTYDTNNSGGLSQSEADIVTTINIAGSSSAKGGYTDLTGIEYFKNLTNLICSYNSITALDVSENTALTSLKCDYNELTYLITGNNSKLKTLWCDNNHLTSLDISGNTGLTSFIGSSNSYSIGALTDTFSLSSLPGNFDVNKASGWTGAVCDNSAKTLSSFTSTTIKYTYDCGNGKTLQFSLIASELPSVVAIDSAHFPDSTFREYVKNTFDTDGNGKLSQSEINAATRVSVAGSSSATGSITTLKGIEYLTAVTYIDCDYNQITSLDLSSNTALSTLWCRYNQLTSLDLSKNTPLTSLYCRGNSYSIGDISRTFSLSSLPGNFDVSKASNWTGAVCDTTSKTLGSFTSATVTYTYDCGSGKTATFTLSASSIPAPDVVTIDTAHFPDSTFRQYVSDEFDTDGSGGLSQEEINNATSVSVSGTSDNPGSITSLKGIEYLTEITYIGCRYNQITGLDLSANTKLITLICDVNKLNSLDVSSNTLLELISCSSNQLTALDIGNNTALKQLYCEFNQITSLDVSRNTLLEILYCHTNQLTSLNVSNNTLLTALDCHSNQLAYIDISNNTALTSDTFSCYSNIYSIGAVVGSYSLSDIPGFDSSRASGWSGAVFNSIANVIKDFTGTNVTYDYDCGNGIIKSFILSASSYSEEIIAAIDETHFPDPVFRQYVLNNFDKNKNGSLSKSEAAAVTFMNVNEMNIGSIEGIEYFTKLTSLFCTDNSITDIDMTSNTKLQYIFCERNNIGTINVTNCSELITLSCFDNSISSVDVSANTKLENLWCQHNRLTQLDLTNNTVLRSLDGAGNIYSIGKVTDSYRLSNIPGFASSRTSNWQGASYDSTTNSLKNFTSQKVTYDYDCGNGYSINVTLTAEIDGFADIKEEPADTSVIEGLDTTLTVKAEGTDITYQWQRSSGDSWVNISGAVNSVLTLKNVTYDMDGTKYRCIVTAERSQTSAEAVLTVKPAEEVTAAEVAAMSIDEAVKFVNAFSARYEKSGQDTAVLTAAQLSAIERVLEYDHKA